MTDMVERVARALVERGRIDGAAENLARIAIEAMREPSEGMHKAGNDEMDAMDAGNGNAFCEHIWRAMIDAALGRGGE